MITQEEFNAIIKIIIDRGVRLRTYRTKSTITSADDQMMVMDFDFTLVTAFHGSHNRTIGVHLPTGIEYLYSSWGDDKLWENHKCSEETERILRNLLKLNDE